VHVYDRTLVFANRERNLELAPKICVGMPEQQKSEVALVGVNVDASVRHTPALGQGSDVAN